MFSEYEVVCRQWREKFSGYDPGRIARILHLETDENDLYLTYFAPEIAEFMDEGRIG